MKNFKTPLALSLAGLIFCSCSQTSLTERSNSLTKPRQEVMQSRMSQLQSGTSEEAARPYAKNSAGRTPFGRPAKRNNRVIHVRTTAYSCAEKEKGGIYGNKNAIGSSLRYGKIRSAAADWSRFPLGTQFKIVGEPYIYVIDDYGSALVGTDTIDIYKPNLSMMRAWGVRHIDIEIIKWGCYMSSYTILDGRKHAAPHCWQMYKHLKPKVKSVGS